MVTYIGTRCEGVRFKLTRPLPKRYTLLDFFLAGCLRSETSASLRFDRRVGGMVMDYQKAVVGVVQELGWDARKVEAGATKLILLLLGLTSNK